MTNNTDPFSLTVRRCGPIASDLLQQAATGSVAAVFDRCFYVRLGTAYLCIGNSNFSDGPVNVITSAPAMTCWSACGLKAGDRAVLVNGRLRIGRHLTLSCEDTVVWRPEPLPMTGLAPASLQNLQQFYARKMPTEGLAPRVFGALHAPLPQAGQPLAALSTWLSEALQTPQPPLPLSDIKRLMGMGPGLTPSGDDFLGGMMITLRALQESGPLSALASAIRQAAPAATHPISASLLYAASQGLGSSPFHDLLSALGRPDRPAQTAALTRLVAIGHTSGWDAVAGLYATLKIWQSVRQSDVIAA